MKLKTHAAFRAQLDRLDGSVGLLWFMIVTSGRRHRIERISVSKADAARQLSIHFTPDKYKFIRIHNQMPVFKKL